MSHTLSFIQPAANPSPHCKDWYKANMHLRVWCWMAATKRFVAHSSEYHCKRSMWLLRSFAMFPNFKLIVASIFANTLALIGRSGAKDPTTCQKFMVKTDLVLLVNVVALLPV